MAIVAAVSAMVVAGRRQGGVLGADLDQQLPAAPCRLRERRDLVPRAGGGAGEDHGDHGEQAALRGRLAAAHLGLEREEPRERLGAGEPADQPRGGRLELEAQDQLAIEAVGGREEVLAGGDRLRQLPREEAHHREAEGGVRTLGGAARQSLRRFHAAGRLGQAGGRLGGAEVEQDPAPQRRRRRLVERAAQEPHRLVGRAAVAGQSRRGRQRRERPRLPDGPGRARGQQVGGRALGAGGVARQLGGGGEMQLRALGRRDRVLERLLDDRMDEPRRKAGAQDLGLDQRVHRSARRLARPRPRPQRRPRATRRRRGSRALAPRSRPSAGVVAAGRPRSGPPTAGPARRSRRRRALRRPRPAPRGRRGADARAAGSRPSSGRTRRRPHRPSSAPRLSRTSSAIAAGLSGSGRTACSGSPSTSPVSALGDRRLAGPPRDDHAGRDLLDPRLQVGEEPERMLVRPVRVVDEHGERALLRQPRAQPVQPVEPREQAVVAGRAVGDLLEQRARQPRGAGERPCALALGERLDAGASSWMTTPSVNSRSIALPRARRTAIPPSGPARRPHRAASVLPIPAAPSITTMRPEPAAAARSAPPICSSSASRSSRWGRRSRPPSLKPAVGPRSEARPAGPTGRIMFNAPSALLVTRAMSGEWRRPSAGCVQSTLWGLVPGPPDRRRSHHVPRCCPCAVRGRPVGHP